MTELRVLAKFVHDLNWEAVPADVKETTKNVLIDSVGVGIGACRNEQNVSIINEFTSLCSDHSVSIWGQGKKTSLFQAVFLNALEGHTLEMDDVHTRSKTHIGTVVTPAVWSVAEYEKKTGQELLLAELCGYEVTARIGMALGVSAHRNLGWHATSTAGVIGAAAACAKLLGLTENQIVYAMGMAAQEAGGTWAFLGDGASCKILNPATAACTGAKCAYLAKAGMTGPEHVLTTEDGGMLAAMSNGYDVSKVSADLGKVWEVKFMDNKPYPCCRSTHCTIDGSLYLREHEGVRPENVDHVDVFTYLVGNKQCGMSEGSIHPTKAVEAKFSTPFTVASALLYGRVTLEEFTQEKIDDPKVQELLSRVKVITDDSFTNQYPDHWGCRVVAYMKDGRTCEVTIPDASGSTDNPLTIEQLTAKIKGILLRVMDEKQADQTMEYLHNIESAEKLQAV